MKQSHSRADHQDSDQQQSIQNSCRSGRL